MESISGDEKESIPLYSPREAPPPPPPKEKEEEEEKKSEGPGPVAILTVASHRMSALCAASTAWEIMNTSLPMDSLLCFSYRDRPRRYRVAGRVASSNAVELMAQLKDMPKGSFLIATEHVKSFGENVEQLKHTVSWPGPFGKMGHREVVIEGVQQCLYIEDSKSYLYLFVASEPVSVLFGVRIRELDKDAGCEVDAIIEWEHKNPGLWSWASDQWVESTWMTAENLIEWSHFFWLCQKNEKRV